MNRRPHDKVEASPTSRATCKICNLKIMKGDSRIGQHFFLYKYKKWGLQYYHCSCVEKHEDILNDLNFPKKQKSDDTSYARSKRKLEDVLSSPNKEWIQMEINNLGKSNEKRRRLIHDERGSLRENLRKLRTTFASRLAVPPYFIFHDSVLDEIVEEMPTNKDELLRVKGIGPKKFESFGLSILLIIGSYRRSLNINGSKQKKSKGIEEDDEEDIVVEKSLTVNEIVERRFLKAKQKGNVIEL